MSNLSNFNPPRTGEAKLTSGFFAKRVDNYVEIIKNMENALLEENNAARLLNFGIAAGKIKGKFYMNEWSDGDCYKFIEGCSNQYAVTKDKKILDIINKYIPWIEATQEEDGYICTQVQLTDLKRWAKPANHELYNFGHLFTASCVHYEATNDDRLLNVAKKAADYLCTIFIPMNTELGNFGFNPSQIMGLVELYNITKNDNYLKLADIFVTMRGTKIGNGDQNQNRVPLRDEYKPVGHAVTASYLYAGAADVYAHTKDKRLLTALERIWNDMIDRRIYITGGASPVYVGISERGDRIQEAFSDEFNLPNRISYNETCANIAVAMWALRMYNLTSKATYGDWMENILLNSGISGASLDMTRYFYANPLSHRVNERIKPTFEQYTHVPNKRFYTFDCWCCPPQLWRTFTGMPKWIYSITDNGISINLFAGSSLNTHLSNNEPVKININTNYPWEEEVKIDIIEAPCNGMNLTFRIPSWCNNATFNHKPIESGIHNVIVKTGEILNIVLPMKPTLYTANPFIEQANGMLAVKRGPVVYCLEGCDIDNEISIDELAIPVQAEFTEEIITELPYNMVGLKSELIHRPKGNKIYYPVIEDDVQKVSVRFIPYFAWANRQESDMSVWLPRA
ncbi:ATP-binding protein [Vallitalea longa]|uniref:ATP-binding protein n=1 Tax=Vallitalea longa TaxID=2936439 RepID=A0A9W5Y7G3_9FIRM|nr:beta-L-arabinofuranosidase domain-containing protein [Vallitalea longa]GKX28210.1 ATP-binding protein [Vallitalea longa]